MRAKQCVALAVATAVGLLVEGSAVASSAINLSPVTVVTGPSPYANCTAGAGTGTVYVNAEVEPYVAINPANALNIVGAWQQDRWNNGGAHGLVAGYSFDGGQTWGETPLPFSACAKGGLSYERASDPWVSIGPDGTIYANAISFDIITTTRNAVAAATSSDGGKTWKNLSVLVSYDATEGSQFSTDKNSITADPVKAGVAYSVWDTLIQPTDQPDDNPHASYAAAYSGPAYFSRTSNGGKTWSTPQVMVSTGNRQQTIGNLVVVAPDGSLYDFFDLILPPNAASLKPPPKTTNYNLAFVKSTDGGTTWSKSQTVAQINTVYVSDPNTGAAIRTGDIIPEVAINPANGQLYAVWQDADFNGGHYDEVAFSTSTDGGKTWSAPIRVNTPTGRPAFTPQVHVNASGTVGVTYYDFRNLQAGNTSTLPTDYWLAVSTDGGKSFGNEAHVAGSFDMLTAPNARGYFVGDYEGLASVGTTFRPLFVQANSGNTANRTDVFSTAATAP